MVKFEEFRSKEELIEYLKTAEGIRCRTVKEAEKYISDHLPKEPVFQRRIMDAIRAAYPSAFVWKASAGPYGRAGIPDVCAIIGGRFYGFEVKRPFLGVPSKLQLQTIERIRKAGGQAHIVSWPADAIKILRAAEG